MIPQLRVLVIDDSIDNAESLCALLASLGCDTAVAFGGLQGVQLAAAFDPHLAFSDLDMPGMDGCEVARQLRACHQEWSQTLICITGRWRPDVLQMCIEAGFDDVFTKPVAPKHFVELIYEANAAAKRRGSEA